MGNEDPVAPTPSMRDGEIRSAFLNMDQAMTSQANTFTSQVQSMTGQVNKEVGPRMPHHTTSMASRLRDFTRMNHPMLFRSRVDEQTQEFLDEVYKIFLDMGVTSKKKSELAAYQLKDVVQTWYT